MTAAMEVVRPSGCVPKVTATVAMGIVSPMVPVLLVITMMVPRSAVSSWVNAQPVPCWKQMAIVFGPAMRGAAMAEMAFAWPMAYARSVITTTGPAADA
jgi:vancomycin permeability regulator SanA